jgi:hypothetical protein
MGSKGSRAPDYTGAAEAEAAANFKNLQYQTKANRPDMYTPWGSSTWTGNPSTGYYQNRILLSPEIQSALDDQLAIQSGVSNAALGLLDNVSSDMNTPSDFWDSLTPYSGVNVPQYSSDGLSSFGAVPDVSGLGQGLPQGGRAPSVTADGSMYGGLRRNLDLSGLNNVSAEYDPKYANAAYSRAMALVEPSFRQDQNSLRTLLANQGLTQGGENYDDALSDMYDDQSTYRMMAAWDAVGAGENAMNADFNRQLALRGQGYNEALGSADYGLSRADLGLREQGLGFDQGMSVAGFNEGQRAARFNEDLASLDAGFRQSSLANQIRGQQFGENMAMGNQQFRQDLSSANLDNLIRQQQIAEQMQKEGWSLNKINSLLYGNQVQMPQFPSFSNAGYVGGPDYTGAAAAQGQYQTENNPWNAYGQIASGMLGGQFGGALGSWLF